MSMETLHITLEMSVVAAAMLLLGYIAFLLPLPQQPKKRKWKQCPTCKKWQEAK